jgi:hypothetical protein
VKCASKGIPEGFERGRGCMLREAAPWPRSSGAARNGDQFAASDKDRHVPTLSPSRDPRVECRLLIFRMSDSEFARDICEMQESMLSGLGSEPPAFNN